MEDERRGGGRIRKNIIHLLVEAMAIYPNYNPSGGQEDVALLEKLGVFVLGLCHLDSKGIYWGGEQASRYRAVARDRGGRGACVTRARWMKKKKKRGAHCSIDMLFPHFYTLKEKRGGSF